MDPIMYALPQFAFSRVMYFCSRECGYSTCFWSLYDINGEMLASLIALYMQALIYMLLALYLYQVLPQTYGVPKKWNYLCKKQKKGNGYDIEESEHVEVEDEEDGNRDFFFETSLEDQDSKAMRSEVYNLDERTYYKYPLVIKDLRKLYPGFGGRPPKPAVKKFCLKIKKGETFGMLGPNGAGKTTLISMLTGMYRPSGGNAWVAGYNIKDQLEIVQLQIGVCPQFDLLWGDLTVEEHLYFYARLKGIPPEREKAQVEKAIQEVLLQKFRQFKVSSLSGGMKRRLSVAISLVSDPKIVYLDEPSTGLDPENRRQLWDILAACRGQRALILTTHSMEEADVLCQRIGIVCDGVLRCVGPQIRLKSMYGGGYNLFINCQRGKVLQLVRQIKLNEKKKRRIQQDAKQRHIQKVLGSIGEDHKSDSQSDDEDLTELIDDKQIASRLQDFINKLIPNIILIRGFNGMFVYQIPNESFKADSLFVALESNKKRLRIMDWGVSQSTLEDVFSRICEHS